MFYIVPAKFMPKARVCPKCGAELPSDAPEELCRKCSLLANVFGSSRAPTALELSSELQTPFEEPLGKIGRYKLLEKLGEGGFGDVWMAEQEDPVRRRVALKIIKLGMDTREVVARFEAERQALALMDHPNIAKVLDAGATDTGRPYFVMELVRGIKITEYCDQNALSTPQRLELFIAVCQAVQHAHQKGIIHRDIKPSNILVTVNEAVPVPKVIDFGIAKATQGRLTDKTVFTAFEQFIGTPAYMSPEQAVMTSLDVDTRTDIYSLGVLLYELLTGQTPFEKTELLAVGLEEMRRLIRDKEPMRPSTRLSGLGAEEQTSTAKRRQTDVPRLIRLVRGDLDWIVMKCLEKDRTRRYETANGLAFDLKRHLTNEPVLARPASAAYKLQKAFRRNKLVYSAAAAIALALVAGLTLAAMGWRQTRVERDKALQARAGEEAQRKAAQASEAEAVHLLYVAKMNLAQRAWDQNNIGGLRQLLLDTKDSPHRGFEWYYWQPKTHVRALVLRGHSNIIRSVAFSPDGQRIVSGSDDQTAKVWDAATGRELLTLTGHSDIIRFVAFSPDGQRIVTCSGDRTAKVWETANGRQLLTLTGHSETVASAAFSPDGQRIATACLDRTAKVWDTATGKELLTLRGHSNWVESVAFSPDGQRIVSGGDDQTAKVWDAASGRELLTLKGYSSGLVSFSPDGQRIVTVDQRQWDSASGRELRVRKLPPFTGDGDWINYAASSRDGRRIVIVTGSSANTAKLCDAATGRELFTYKGHSSCINSVAFSPDDERIVTGSSDNTAYVWEVASGVPPRDKGGNLLTLTGHSEVVDSVAFSPDGQRIVTGSFDRTAKVWDAASGRELLTLVGHSEIVNSVAFSPDGQRIVTGSGDRTAKVWDSASGRELLPLRGHSDWVASVSFSPDGQRIVTGSNDKTAKVWDAASGRELLTLTGHNALIRSVAFSPDGQRVATGSSDRTKVWDAASGRELLTLRGQATVAFSPNGQRIVTGSSDQTAKVWDATSGRELLTLTGHNDVVNSVAFSPDGQRILTSSWDRTAKVWEADTGQELLTLKGHTSVIWDAVFSPDGLRIVTGSSDGTAKVWEAARKQQVTQWQVEESRKGQAR
jgi:WD40 repeat protein